MTQSGINFPDNPSNNEEFVYNDGEGRVVKYRYYNPKDSWTGTINTSIQIADPIPAQVTANPPFTSGSGTQEDPYIVSPATCATQGLGVLSSQQIIISGQTLGQRIYFNDQSQNAGLRFQQPLGVVDGFGVYLTNLIYNDDPKTFVDGIVYSALWSVGTAWLSWDVTQQVTDPISQNSATSISVSGNVWKVGETASMVSGTITGGSPGTGYTYEYWWQRSPDGSEDTYTNITEPSSDVSAKNYIITEDDTNSFLRGVTRGTDSTIPVKQTLVMPSPNSSTKIFGPPRIATVTLVDDDGPSANRFTSQSYTTTYVLGNDGTGNSTKQLKAVFTLPDLSVRYGILGTNGLVANITNIDPGFTTLTDQVNMKIDFPATFTDTIAPDEALPIGTALVTSLKVFNNFGEDVENSNSITPEVVLQASYPVPTAIEGFIQYEDPFLLDQNPWNTAVVQGTNKQTYSFAWGTSPTTITFNPAWDTSASPITSFQGGGVEAGIDDFRVSFVDGSDATTTAIVSTPNSDWSSPISFGAFTPPTTIKQIILQSDNLTDKTNGVINFYDASNQPVLYIDYVTQQNYLSRLKLEAVDLATSWSTRSSAAAHNLANPSDLKLEAFILPKAGFKANGIYFLHLAKAPGVVNVSIEVVLTNLSTITLTATNLDGSVAYGTFLTNLIAQLGTDSRITIANNSGELKITAADTYAIDDIKVTITSGSLTSQETDDVNDTAVGGPTAANTLIVTVANKTGENHTYGIGSLKAYYINGVEANILAFNKGMTYRFNQSDASNAGHPVRLYTDADKTTEYTTGVTTNGTPGTLGAYTQIATTATAPSVLYYQCSNHGYMGGQITLA